ncbi:MAG: radical SAM family heme chaperone HemW [Firmicutes bacterium]|nr:radical SAM family heme chaperone HemW [Bacillota bacterium]
MNKMRGLYIHVPFCLSKCPYCDFYSVKADKASAKEYKNAVIRNLKRYDREFDTVYFGGGTPILLWKEICGILSEIAFPADAEISLEANPCCATEENLAALRKAGVNRISFGVQSFNDGELKALGRRHNSETAVKAVETAYNCGFENISADIMLATPLQTAESLQNTVDKLVSLPVTHISAYMLKIEENTPFANANLNLPEEDSVCEMYLETAERLESFGFIQYEISNFAKKGCECRHNLKYWNCEEYLGIGPASHSYYNGERFYVKGDLTEFISSPCQITHKEDEEGTAYGSCQEYAMLRLRLSEGLSFEEYEKRGGNTDSLTAKAKTLPPGYAILDGEKIYLTKKGFLVSNSVIAALLEC